MDEKGFYKFDETTTLFGTKVFGPYGAYNFSLDTLTEDKTGCIQENGSVIRFPCDGWYYFETRQEALKTFFKQFS